MPLQLFLILLLPLLGTGLGSLCVFFRGQSALGSPQRILSGFAAGVMVAASVWSLILPAIEQSQALGRLAFLPAFAGIWAGFLLLLLLQCLCPRHRQIAGTSGMVFFAVALHNLPEGMAVGAAAAAFLMSPETVPIAAVLTLSLGIALQNIPEGAIISMPLGAAGTDRRRAFFLGVLSGVVEPIGALLTVALTAHLVPALPFLLSFSAGAMLYVVANDLLPDSGDSRPATVAFGAGFTLMMALDVALGSASCVP